MRAPGRRGCGTRRRGRTRSLLRNPLSRQFGGNAGNRDGRKEALTMEKQPRRHKARRAQTTLTLPELDQSKNTILYSLGSLQSRRSYRHAMDEFIAWYCSEPRLALNRTVVL